MLKSVEGEIDGYEQKLLDEKEKRNKYKVKTRNPGRHRASDALSIKP